MTAIFLLVYTPRRWLRSTLASGKSPKFAAFKWNPSAGLLILAARAGVRRIILNGSFVTDIMEPNDVDCVLLIGRGFPADSTAEAELNAGLPFLEIKIVREAAFERYVAVIFGTDRNGIPKGTIEVIL